MRAILNEYYSTQKSKRQELEKFKEYIDDSAEQIVENYEEAEAKLEDTLERAERQIEKYDCVKSASDNTFFEADGTIKTNYTAKTNDDGNTRWIDSGTNSIQIAE